MPGVQGVFSLAAISKASRLVPDWPLLIIPYLQNVSKGVLADFPRICYNTAIH
jgi:hypothetical protein